ncbi:unnamed protein product [Bubo scandiacus]
MQTEQTLLPFVSNISSQTRITRVVAFVLRYFSRRYIVYVYVLKLHLLHVLATMPLLSSIKTSSCMLESEF